MIAPTEKDEREKASFYYDAVSKMEESFTKSYERNISKVQIFIGILSAVIPILTGVGYLTLSDMSTISFFLFYAISLGILVITLAKCVHLLAPKWFTCVDTGEILRKNDNETLSYNMFQVAASWEDCIKDNIKEINTLYSGVKLIVWSTIIGLVGLIFAFLSLGIEYYLIAFLTITEPYKNLLSPNDWRLLLLGICFIIFAVIGFYIIIYVIRKKDSIVQPSRIPPTP